MKKIKFLVLTLAILLITGHSAFALVCAPSRNSLGPSDDCWSSVTVASNETTLVSAGTVLVYDVANSGGNGSTTLGSYQVRVSTASTNGIFVAGVAQNSIVSGATALVLVRGRGDVALNSSSSIVSGAALFVGVSGDATGITSTTQTQMGFALENQNIAGGTNTRTTKKAYITIV